MIARPHAEQAAERAVHDPIFFEYQRALAPVAEQGVAGFEALAWWGVFAPGATPPALAQRIHEELAKALKAPVVAEKLTAQGMDLVGGSPEALDRFQRAEIERWAKVVRENRIRAGD